MRVIAAARLAVLLALLGAVTASAASAAPPCPPGDARTSAQSDCQPAANRTDAVDGAVDTARNPPPRDAGRRLDGSPHTSESVDDDDDEDACITKAANGVCLDEDED